MLIRLNQGLCNCVTSSSGNSPQVYLAEFDNIQKYEKYKIWRTWSDCWQFLEFWKKNWAIFFETQGMYYRIIIFWIFFHKMETIHQKTSLSLSVQKDDNLRAT